MENRNIEGETMERKLITVFADATAAAEGNGQENSPCKTADGIMAAVLEKVQAGACDITVKMAPGDYLMTKPMVLDGSSVGKYGSTVRFICDGDRIARFCAWVPVTGFEETAVHGKRAWAAPLPVVRGAVLYPHQCFTAAGERLMRPRYPETGYLQAKIVGYPDGFRWNTHMKSFGYEDTAAEKFSRLDEIQILVPHFWKDERLEIAGVDAENKVISTKNETACAYIDIHPHVPADYCFDNVYEMLGTPGQFYVDQVENKLYYIPREEDVLDAFTLYASDLDVMMEIDGIHGTEDMPGLSFENIGFVGSDWKTTARMPVQAATDINGVVRINDVSYLSFKKCRFEHLGDYAIEVLDTVSYLTIQHCVFTDLGTGGITIRGKKSEATKDAVMPYTNHHLVITDNYISGFGRVHSNAIGIVLRLASDCVVSHNEVCDGYYSGISIGWSWGYTPQITKNILVEKNYVHDVGQGMLSDMGGIYMLGMQPGTVIRGNLIHSVYARTDKGWGIYTDEGSQNILIENNIVYDLKSEAFHQHYGKDNLVRNNILAFGHDGIVMVSKPEEHNGLDLVGNILLSDGAPIYLQYPEQMNMRDDRNLAWNLAGDVFCTPKHLSVEEMKEHGFFKNALIADPGFADPKNGDFTLPADSPAFQIGFQPFDMSDVGIRKE